MVVGVLVELSNKKVDKIFSYRVPSDLESSIKIGIRVLVPFASLTLEGFILEIKNDYDDDLKDVIKLLKVYLKVEEAPSNIIEVGDMNNNGKFDMNDIIKLLKTYLNS